MGTRLKSVVLVIMLSVLLSGPSLAERSDVDIAADAVQLAIAQKARYEAMEEAQKEEVFWLRVENIVLKIALIAIAAR